MNKPITLLRQEFMQKQIDLINNSGLPAFILADILREGVQELEKAAQEQYQADKAAWEEQLQKQGTELSGKTEKETE